jgi:hypothetical protein
MDCSGIYTTALQARPLTVLLETDLRKSVLHKSISKRSGKTGARAAETETIKYIKFVASLYSNPNKLNAFPCSPEIPQVVA